MRSGRALLAPEVTRRVIKRFTGGGERVYHPDLVADLTEPEREVLGLTVRGLTNTEIATQLFVGEATVKPTFLASCSSSASATGSRLSCSPRSAAS